MTEAELLARVMAMCREHPPLLVHHCRDSRLCSGSTPGLPDLIIAGEAGLIVAELKSDVGETTPDEDLWIWTLSRGADRNAPGRKISVTVWRPVDLQSGEIEQALEEIR